MKKIGFFCVLLASTLLLASPAYAAGANSRQTVITALCEIPEISVVVPATAEVLINPYQIPVIIESTASTAQIISAPACIENKSQVPISVGVAAAATAYEGSSLRLTNAPTGGAGTDKAVFVYFEMQASATANPAQSIWDEAYDADKHLVVGASPLPEKQIATLSAADGGKQFGAFRLAGDCSESPSEEWSEADGINVKITFSFKPLPVGTEIP